MMKQKKQHRKKSFSSETFFGKIINFIKYHNAFNIVLILLFVFSATIFASEEVRDVIIGEKRETIQGIDNIEIVNKDLDSFDMNILIELVTEDEKNYYIKYSFLTIGIKDNAWQNIRKERTLTVSKESLKGKDLGLYVQKELLEIIENELIYLKEIQRAEIEKGRTETFVTTEYSGLVGLALNIKDKAFSNYDPIIKPIELVVDNSEKFETPLVESKPIQQQIIEELEVEEETSTGTEDIVIPEEETSTSTEDVVIPEEDETPTTTEDVIVPEEEGTTTSTEEIVEEPESDPEPEPESELEHDPDLEPESAA